MMRLARWLNKAANTVMPHINKCVVCSIEAGVVDSLCNTCRDKLSAQVHGITSAKDFDALSVFNYSGEVAKLTRAYKYNGKRYLADFMATQMTKALKGDYSAVCHVPLHKKRLRRRGFDQAELLAKSISDKTGIPFINVIERTRNTKTQVSLGQKQRRENMRGAFIATGSLSGNVLLVDDVLTTGATTAECAGVLLGAGKNPDEVIKKLEEKYSEYNINTDDGLRIDFDDHWVHFRKSNTEPIIRCIVEAKTEVKANLFIKKYFAELS